MALELTNKNAGEVYISESGHLEFAYSASAGQVLNKAFGVPMGEAFGFMAGSPAAIGLVMADTAMKSASLSIAKYMTPDKGTSHSNEVILAVAGDASAAKTAVLNARQIGLEHRNGQLSGDPGGTIFIKKILTFASGIHIIINGKFKKQIFGIIGNGTSSWMVMNNTNL